MLSSENFNIIEDDISINDTSVSTGMSLTSGDSNT